MRTKVENPFWAELERFLHGFLEDLSPNEGQRDERPAATWWSGGKGSLDFDQEEVDKYAELLRSAQRHLAPREDLSRATIDRSLQDAVFAVKDAKGLHALQVAESIEIAVATARETLERGPERYECWIEVHGLDLACLPSSFGRTEFQAFGASHLEQLDDLDRLAQSEIPHANRLHLLGPDGSVEGRAVAIQRAFARDSEAAVLLATREVGAAVECLNCFAEIIPYNRAVLRVASAQPASGSAVRFAYSDAGSFLNSPVTEIPWEFSMTNLQALDGMAGEAVTRLDRLLSRAERSDVEELLLRAARWVGRASAAETAEDSFLYSGIAIDCILKPVSRSDKVLLRRLAWAISDITGVGDIRRLWGMRNDLVHDGRLEIPEFDRRAMYAIALNLVVRMLTSVDIQDIENLKELDAHFDHQTQH